MNAAGPVYAALVMDYLTEEERPGFFLLESALWSLLFAPGKRPLRAVQEALGLKAFDLLFGGPWPSTPWASCSGPGPSGGLSG